MKTYPTYWRTSNTNDLRDSLIDEIQLDRLVGDASDATADSAIEAVYDMYPDA